MMKRTFFTLLCLVVLSAAAGWSEEIYCRYQAEDGAHYGRVMGNSILQLCAAPWDGGIPTGHIISKSKVKFLHPSEPQKLLGMAGTYREAWTDGKKPFNTVRWFLKPPSAAASPNDDVEIPAALDLLMGETELVIVIGKKVKNADVPEAKDAIFGYTLGNDIVGCATSYHRVNGEPLNQPESLLMPGLKQGDRFSPYGPFIYRGVDWNNRERTLVVSNSDTGKKLTYRHNTSNLIYTPAKIVSDLSRVFTLFPGDVIFTGTTKALPAEAGDIMKVSVEGFESITNRVSAPRIE